MMQLTVKYFALYREVVGAATQQVTSAAQTPEALFGEVAQRHEGLQRFAATRVAINDELADWQQPLRDGDVVLFFPPVAGG